MDIPMMPFADHKITLSDGREAVVVKQHHASPAERWKMWCLLRNTVRDARADGVVLGFRKCLRLRFMFLSTVLDPGCQACWYEVRDVPDSSA